VKTAEEAKQVQNKLAKGEDFIELAKRYSIDPNAKTTGGEIGFHPKGTLLPEYEAAAFKLSKVGQISPVVKTQFGYHIIRLEATKGADYVPFEEVKEFIKQKLSQEKQKEIVEKYITELRGKAKISVNEGLLKTDKDKQEKTEKLTPSEKPGQVGQPEAPGKIDTQRAPEPKK